MRVKLAVAVATALDKGNRRVLIPDIGFDKNFTDSEILTAFEPLQRQLAEFLISPVAALGAQGFVRVVICTGGGTKLHPLWQTVRTAFPEKSIHQVDPDVTIARGVAFPMPITAVAPYSIGIHKIGDIVLFVIQRGETLPAISETRWITTVDNQKGMTFVVYQGEHILSDRAHKIGETELTGLTLLPRGKCWVTTRIECDTNGILRFSAMETQTGKSIRATFHAKTRFSEADQRRLRHESGESKAEEEEKAAMQFYREHMELDAERALKSQNRKVRTEGHRLQKWLDNHSTGHPRVFAKRALQMRQNLYLLDPENWEAPDSLRPYVPTTVIWPIGCSFTDEGAMIFRFLTRSRYRSLYVLSNNVDTNEWSRTSFTHCIVHAEKRIEHIVRLEFPRNGKYRVQLFVGETSNSQGDVSMATWIVDVGGAPAPERHIAQLIHDRQFVSVNRNYFRCKPSQQVVKLVGNQYQFRWKFRGKTLRIVAGMTSYWSFSNRTIQSEGGDAWASGKETFECPYSGIWWVTFWVDNNDPVVQTIIPSPLVDIQLTAEEEAALTARVC
jgi:hypothetical protein